MKKIHGKVLLSFLLLLASAKIQAEAGAMIAPDQQDLSVIENNPHPPVTEADKNRVRFGEIAVSVLTRKLPVTPKETAPQIYDTPDKNFNWDEDCLLNHKDWQQCPDHDAFQNYLNDILAKYGSLLEFRHAHIIPWSFEKFKNPTVPEKTDAISTTAPPLPPHIVAREKTAKPMPVPVLKSDEYMIHIYGKFNNNTWYHLDVIVSEDAAGKMTFRRFYIFELPRGGSRLPDGVVC